MDHGVSNEGGELVRVIWGGERVRGPGEQQRRHGDPVDVVVWGLGRPVFDLPFMGSGIFHKILQTSVETWKQNHQILITGLG